MFFQHLNENRINFSFRKENGEWREMTMYADNPDWENFCKWLNDVLEEKEENGII